MQYISRHANFSNMGTAMLTLVRMTTGENWDGLMQDCMVTAACVYVKADLAAGPGCTFTAGEYLDKSALKGLQAYVGSHLVDQCSPSPAVSIVFFCSYVIICGLMLLNLVIAVILENMANSASDDDLAVNKAAVLQFVAVWAELDPAASNYIPVKDLPTLVAELDPPLGARGEECGRAKVQQIIMAVDIPNRGNRVRRAALPTVQSTVAAKCGLSCVWPRCSMGSAAA